MKDCTASITDKDDNVSSIHIVNDHMSSHNPSTDWPNTRDHCWCSHSDNGCHSNSNIFLST